MHPLMVKLITLAAVGTCSIYISSICSNQAATSMKPDSVRLRQIEKHSYDYRLVSLKKRETKIMPGSTKQQPSEEHSYDPITIDLEVTDSKQTKVQMKPEPEMIKPRQVRTELKQPTCQNPGIPQSEISYVHYPVPTNYRR